MWWLWASLGDDAIGFRLDPTRAHDVPEKHFAAILTNGGSMVLMVVRYSAYKAMKQDKLGLILLAFCWSHVRRDFIEAYVKDKRCGPWAIKWLQRIRLNRSGLIEVGRPVLKRLLSDWDGLCRFVDDERIPLDNNASERA